MVLNQWANYRYQKPSWTIADIYWELSLRMALLQVLWRISRWTKRLLSGTYCLVEQVTLVYEELSYPVHRMTVHSLNKPCFLSLLNMWIYTPLIGSALFHSMSFPCPFLLTHLPFPQVSVWCCFSLATFFLTSNIGLGISNSILHLVNISRVNIYC